MLRTEVISNQLWTQAFSVIGTNVLNKNVMHILRSSCGIQGKLPPKGGNEISPRSWSYHPKNMGNMVETEAMTCTKVLRWEEACGFQGGRRLG
jgi:hypothetical protein